MIVSRGRGHILLHIPKTGGTLKARRRRLDGLRPAGRLRKHSRLAAIEGVVTRAETAGPFHLGADAQPVGPDRERRPMAAVQHLGADMAALADHPGCRPELPAGLRASARERDWPGYVNDETAVSVVRLRRDGIARAGYRFDP